ncbi:MAG: hypothetical protein IMW89_04570 [Ktedonobacteraceae bacterium]|nr:hypothetical protein [Ktedonobacteraceae bacterium]
MTNTENNSFRRRVPRNHKFTNRQEQDFEDEDAFEEFEEEEEAKVVTPPENRLWLALAIGIGGGILGSLFGIVLTMLNSPLYRQAAAEPGNLNLAYALTGFWCLDNIVNLLISFFAGFLVGKIAVRRAFGLYAGILVGVVIYLGNFITNLIPGFPNSAINRPTPSVGAFTGGLLFSLVLLLTIAGIYGLIGLWGATTATRRHPYYTQQAEE